MFKTPYYISPHAITQFKERITNELSTEAIRKYIQYIIHVTQPVMHQKYNRKKQPIYEGELDGIKFWIPVIKEVKKKDACWDVIPTILLEGMNIPRKVDIREEESTRYRTAADIARETGFDRSTITFYIKNGKIKCSPHKKGEYYKVKEAEVNKVKQMKRPYEKWQKEYSETEIYVLKNNKGKPSRYIAKLISRNDISVRIKRSRLRKAGYDV